MPYTLTLHNGVWKVNGLDLHIPHDGGTVNLPILTALDDDGNVVPVSVDVTGAVRIVPSSFVPANYDAINLSYTGQNLTTVVYSLEGIPIKTLTLSYNIANNLISVACT